MLLKRDTMRLFGMVAASVLTVVYLVIMTHLLNKRSDVARATRRHIQDMQLLVNKQAQQLNMEMEHHHGTGHHKNKHQKNYHSEKTHSKYSNTEKNSNHLHDNDNSQNNKPPGNKRLKKEQDIVYESKPSKGKERNKDEYHNKNDDQEPDDGATKELIVDDEEDEDYEEETEEKAVVPAYHPVYYVGAQLCRILLWTPIWEPPGFQVGFGHQPFVDMGCAISQCELTYDRSLLDASDAVVIPLDGAEKVSFSVPPRRTPSQIWIFMNLRPPHHSIPNLQQFTDVFNLTMTYRRDSDIPAPYGKTVSLTKEESKRMADISAIGGYTKLVAWVVNDCATPSKREWFGKELERFIPIDIYGRCGYHECGPNCMEQLGGRYKFLLCFESVLCRDYVSQDVWEALARGMIPVVLGAADYSSILPPRSYIDVREYRSLKDLAEYLLILHHSNALYNEYFAWRKAWKVDFPYGLRSLCEVCARIHDERGRSQVVHGLSDWYSEEKNCFKPTQLFKHIKEFPSTFKRIQHGDL